MPDLSVELDQLRPYLDAISPWGRRMLLPALHAAQDLYGWLPAEVQIEIGKALRVPLADIHGVIEFYSMFYNEPTPKKLVRLCEDPVCALAGFESVQEVIRARLSTTNTNGQSGFERVPCLGMCEHAPAALIGKKPAGGLSPETVDAFLAERLPEPDLLSYGDPKILTSRIGIIDPSSLVEYEAHGGYQGLHKALEVEPEEVISAIESSGILGRGGAMFPLGSKWRFTRSAPGSPADKHIVANADESEPGTFKDRILMEGDPFSLLEGLTLAAYAVGAENGWIFIRGEYPRCYQRLQDAVEMAREAGYLGKNILGKGGFHFDVQLYLGAGAYICGEETALFEAIEGKRGFPRIKPPFPTTHGLFNQPTAINNIETLVAASAAWEMGIEKWSRYGTEGSPGSKLFCLSGRVSRPGLYEVPFGLTIRELIDLAGGVPGGEEIQAVLVGGAAGVFIGPERLDVPLTYEDAHANNFPLGSGVVMVFDETVDLRRVLYQLARFFAHESCGKCFPCQLGTQRQMEILNRVADGNTKPSDRDDLFDLSLTMSQTSLCGLGQTAASAVTSAIFRWPELLA